MLAKSHVSLDSRVGGRHSTTAGGLVIQRLQGRWVKCEALDPRLTSPAAVESRGDDSVKKVPFHSDVFSAIGRRCTLTGVLPFFNGLLNTRFGASQLRSTILQPGSHEEITMSTDTKTPFEHVNDVLAQLKEMRHYAANNVESLTGQWLLFDGELKKLKQAKPIEVLMTRQSELHDALNEEIAVLEELSVQLQPPPEDVS